MKNFSQNLAEARIKAGFSSQLAFAKALGTAQQTYATYESGRSFPKEELLRKIAVTLHVSIDELMGLTAFNSSPTTKGIIAKAEAVRKSSKFVFDKATELVKAIEAMGDD